LISLFFRVPLSDIWRTTRGTRIPPVENRWRIL